jgi:hypothetical protein
MRSEIAPTWSDIDPSRSLNHEPQKSILSRKKDGKSAVSIPDDILDGKHFAE